MVTTRIVGKYKRKGRTSGAQAYTRRRVKSKSTTRSAPRTVGGPNLRMRRAGRVRLPRAVRHNIAGVLNPHGPYRPRLMDGAVAESQTHSNRLTSAIAVGTDATAIFLLQPDLIFPLVYRTSAGGAVQYLNNPETDFHWVTSNIGTTSGTTPGRVDKATSSSIDRWRVVSQGLKMTLLNSTDSNDGYFEIHRVNSRCPIDTQQMQDITSGDGGLIPNAAWLGTLTGIQNNQRTTFMSGALKDIGKLQIRLRPFAEEHPFKNIPHHVEISGWQTYAVGAPQIWSIGEDRNLGWHMVADTQHDSTYDSIAIIVYAGSSAAGSKVLVDVAQNLEVVYENESSLARYHEPTVKDDAAKTALHITTQTNATDLLVGPMDVGDTDI